MTKELTEFTRMKSNHKLVEKLLAEEWWDRVVDLNRDDPDINVQVRTKSINVYCNMGNLMKIELRDNKIACTIHYKYIPLLKDTTKKNDYYINLQTKNNKVFVNQQELRIETDDLMSDKTLSLIKDEIKSYAGEEKLIQSKLVEKNKETILDVEVAFSGKKGTRIDIVNFDKKRESIVAIEIKRIFDHRLYSNKEITEQLQSYSNFIEECEDDIIRAYKNTIETKKALGLIDEKSILKAECIKKVEKKALLVIAGYNQPIIDTLREKIRRIAVGINDNALGVYYFGDLVDLNISKNTNKEIFC